MNSDADTEYARALQAWISANKRLSDARKRQAARNLRALAAFTESVAGAIEGVDNAELSPR
jgi:hypothetical protein